MPQIVHADLAQACGIDQLGEPLRHPLWRDRRSVLASEHQAVVGVGSAPRRALGVLLEAVRHEHAEHAAVQLHDAILTAGCLGPAEGGAEVLAAAVGAGRLLAGEGDELLAHDQDAGLQVDVGPAQPYGLAAT